MLLLKSISLYRPSLNLLPTTSQQIKLDILLLYAFSARIVENLKYSKYAISRISNTILEQ